MTTTMIEEQIAKADRKLVKTAVCELTRTVKDAVDSADKMGYLVRNQNSITQAARLIIDFALEQWNENLPMTTQDSIGFLQLDYAIHSAVPYYHQQEGPLPWLDIVRLILKLLYTIENR